MKQGYQELTINNLEEVYMIVKEYSKLHNLPRNGRGGENGPPLQCVFRGQKNKDWKIEPSCNRIQRTSKTNELNNSDEVFSTLAYLQHYQSGTRFIDFTLDINVALFFACEDFADPKSKDGAIYITSYSMHKQEWYTTESIVEIERIDEEYIKVDDLAERLLSSNMNVVNKMENKVELSTALVSFLESGMMVLPKDEPQKNSRMFNQKGCFYICGYKFIPPLTGDTRSSSRAGNNLFQRDSVNIMKSFKEGHYYLLKVIIPKECKESIMQQIKSEGITKEFLFPD